MYCNFIIGNIVRIKIIQLYFIQFILIPAVRKKFTRPHFILNFGSPENKTCAKNTDQYTKKNAHLLEHIILLKL